MTKIEQKKPTAFALFAGGGGMHLGIERAGFNILVSSDVTHHAKNTHNLNWPNLPFLCEDVRKVHAKDLLQLSGGIKPDLIFGGPPCQGFSTLGDKISADPRNNLFAEFARIVEELNPKFVLMENVKTLTTMYKGRFKDHIIDVFTNLGYRMYWKVLNAADYGVPQFRQRVIFFGTKHPAIFSFPEPSHGPVTGNAYKTAWQAIGDLNLKGVEIPNHIVLNHSATVIERYKLIPEGGKLPPPSQLPKEIRRKNFGNTYKRLSRNEPSLTMVPGNNAFPIHPTQNRSLTPREAARLQTFPDSFIFTGDRRTQCILVGNAVPPLLAESLGNSILKHAVCSEIAEPTPAIDVKEREIQISSAVKKNWGFVDLFSGAGGFMIGFEKAGLHPLVSVDINKYVEQTHLHNHISVPFIAGDLSKPDTINLISSSIKEIHPAIVVGGPPCQGFSIFGKRRFVNTKGYIPHKDPRNKLVYSYIETVSRLKPRWFVMENVPGFANLDSGFFLQEILKKFNSIGYPNVEARILLAADYGVPQLRKRLIIIGNNTGHIIPWPKKKYFAEPKEWQDPYRTVGEVLSDLTSKKSYLGMTCHVPMKHKPLLVERYKYIPEGGVLNVEKLPEELRKGYRTEKVKNYSHVFKRLHRDRPSFTMVPGHNAFPIHYSLNRALTVREAARIQTFPDEVEFMGPRQEQCIQVGNAFPPLLAEVIANCIVKCEKNSWYPGTVPASAYYSIIEKQIDS